MNRLSRPGPAIAGTVFLGLTSAAAITITPASHDYGDYAVNATAVNSPSFEVVLVPGAAPGTTLTFTVQGPDAGDFAPLGLSRTIQVDRPNDGCVNTSQRSVCSKPVGFRPGSLGPKLATLVVTDNHGGRAIAQLKGKGVAPLCRHVVVPCNYSHFYSGAFSWTITLNGPRSQYTQTVDVTVTNGAALCHGVTTEREMGRSRTGAIAGPGLIAVEFLTDPVHDTVYLISAACPSPDWPGSIDEAPTPSRPAEMGHNEQNSEKQPTLACPSSPWTCAVDLEGSITYPSPDADPANGVTGNVKISWKLKRS